MLICVRDVISKMISFDYRSFCTMFIVNNFAFKLCMLQNMLYHDFFAGLFVSLAFCLERVMPFMLCLAVEACCFDVVFHSVCLCANVCQVPVGTLMCGRCLWEH